MSKPTAQPNARLSGQYMAESMKPIGRYVFTKEAYRDWMGCPYTSINDGIARYFLASDPINSVIHTTGSEADEIAETIPETEETTTVTLEVWDKIIAYLRKERLLRVERVPSKPVCSSLEYHALVAMVRPMVAAGYSAVAMTLATAEAGAKLAAEAVCDAAARIEPSEHALNRIPPFQGDAKAWYFAMAAAGLDYHIEDDPEEIIHGPTWVRLFTAAECATLEKILATFTKRQYEQYFAAGVSEMHKGGN